MIVVAEMAAVGEVISVAGMRRVEVGLVGLLMATNGCSPVSSYDLEHPPEVVLKEYEPERTYSTNRTTYTSLMIGETFLPIPSGSDTIQIHDDEDFILRLGGKNGLFKVYVASEVYQTVKVGDFLDLSKIQYSLED